MHNQNLISHWYRSNWSEFAVLGHFLMWDGSSQGKQMLVPIWEYKSSSPQVYFTASLMLISSVKKTLAVISMLLQHWGAMIAAFFSD